MNKQDLKQPKDYVEHLITEEEVNITMHPIYKQERNRLIFWLLIAAVFIVSAICSVPALASGSFNNEVHFMMKSRHNYDTTREGKKYNETHTLFGYKKKDFFLGTYNNSHNRQSVLIAKDYNSDIGLCNNTIIDGCGVLIGLISGYKGTRAAIPNENISLAIIPHFKVNLYKDKEKALGLNFIVLPHVQSVNLVYSF